MRINFLLLVVVAGVLAGCETAADGADAASGSTSSSPLPAARGPGLETGGGLLARLSDTGGAEAGDARIEGQILQGRFVEFMSRGDNDRAGRAALAAIETLPSGKTETWRNAKNGHWGTMTPRRTYMDDEGRYCRDYRQTVTLGGQEHRVDGTLCRRPDGVWQAQS